MYFLGIISFSSLIVSDDSNKQSVLENGKHCIHQANSALVFKELRCEGRFHEQSYDLY